MLASTADAKLEGPLEHGKKAILSFDKQGLVSKAKFVRWHARCPNEGEVKLITTFNAPFDGLSSKRFHDRLRETIRDRKYRIHVRASVKGRQTSRYHWEGRFRAKAKVTVHGDHLTTCRLGSRGWSASKKAGSLRLHSAGSDYIGGGGGADFSYRAPGSPIAVDGDRHYLVARMADWTVDLAASSNGRLVAGRTYRHARRFEDRRHPGIDVYGYGRGCNETFGEFKLIRLRFEHHRITNLKFNFVQHCERPGRPPLRGRFNYIR